MFRLLTTTCNTHFGTIHYADQQIAAAAARLRHSLVWNPDDFAALYAGRHLDAEKLPARSLHGFCPTLESASGIYPQLGAKIEATDLEAKTRQRLRAELHHAALECPAASNAKASAGRGPRRDVQAVDLRSVRIRRIVHVDVDRRAPEKIFNSDPDFLRDIAGEWRGAFCRRSPAGRVQLAVVGASPGRVAQDFVSSVERLDLDTGGVRTRVGVGMKLFRQLSIGVADLGAGAAAVQSEYVVMIRFWGADR